MQNICAKQPAKNDLNTYSLRYGTSNIYIHGDEKIYLQKQSSEKITEKRKDNTNTQRRKITFDITSLLVNGQ